MRKKLKNSWRLPSARKKGRAYISPKRSEYVSARDRPMGDPIPIEVSQPHEETTASPVATEALSVQSGTQLVRGACCILLAAAMFVPVARKLYKWNRVSDGQRRAAASELVDPWNCLPEPGERSSYIAGCLFAPALLLGLAIASRQIDRVALNLSPWFPSGVQILLLVALSCYAWWLLAGDQFFPIGLNVFYRRPITAVPILLCLLPLIAWLNKSSSGARRFGYFLVGAPMLAIFLANLLGSSDFYVSHSNHFPAVFEPVAQVYLGKNLLVDYASQYGLYPDFLAPLFGLVGFSVLRFTLVFGLLSAVSFGLLWMVLRQAIVHRGVAIVGFLALFFNGWLMFQLRTIEYHSDFADLYYQYIPLRFVFPASAVALTWFYHRNRSPRLYWVAQVVLACGVLWNFESGLVAQAAWLGALAFDSLYEGNWLSRGRGVAKHLLATILATASVAACYAIVKFCWFGVWPDFARLWDYQRLFYLSGYYMLPMHFRGAWQLVVLLYLAGLTQAAFALTAGDRSPRNTLVVMLSVLGLGLFSYYQGRSHELCLILCWWPALVLLPIFLDELLELRQRQLNWLAWGLIALSGWFLIGSAASMVSHWPSFCRFTADQLAKAFDSDVPFADTAHLLRQQVAPQEGVLVLSAYAPLIHSESRIPTLGCAPLIEMLLVRQYKSLLDTLERRPHSWIFIDHNCSNQLFFNPQKYPRSKLLLESISPRLHQFAETSLGYLYEFHGSGPSTPPHLPAESIEAIARNLSGP